MILGQQPMSTIAPANHALFLLTAAADTGLAGLALFTVTSIQLGKKVALP